MHKTMAATALSFLMAMGGGAALADAGGQTSSSSRAQGSRANANMKGPVGFAEEEVETAPWTVQRVDKQNHHLVLRAPDGTQNTVDIPAGTPGFDSLKKGDQIQLDYFDAAVVEPAAPTSANGSDRSATGNSSNRKVRNIRKVGHNNNSNSMGHNGSTGSTTHSGATDTSQPAQGNH
jgi:hypothetical protein